MKFINVRGCNGSGKTHLLRLFALSPLCFLRHFTVVHTVRGKKTGERIQMAHPPIPVTFCPDGIAILGDYTSAAAGRTTAGCDRIKTQEAAKKVLEIIATAPATRFILFEGVVVSTIFGPWKEWAEKNGGMAWAFLDTPLDVCLKRIQQRNGGKPIKEDQVAAKHRTIQRVRDKALNAGQTVLNLDHKKPLVDLLSYMDF